MQNRAFQVMHSSVYRRAGLIYILLTSFMSGMQVESSALKISESAKSELSDSKSPVQTLHPAIRQLKERNTLSKVKGPASSKFVPISGAQRSEFETKNEVFRYKQVKGYATFPGNRAYLSNGRVLETNISFGKTGQFGNANQAKGYVILRPTHSEPNVGDFGPRNQSQQNLNNNVDMMKNSTKFK